MNADIKSGKVGKDPETCCAPACSRYNCSAGWVANPEEAKNSNKTGSDEACCLETCELHNCPSPLVAKPDISSAVGNTDEECCEPPYCDFIRKKLKRAPNGCQEISQESCDQHAYSYVDNSSQTVVVECDYDGVVGLCRNRGKETKGCKLA